MLFQVSDQPLLRRESVAELVDRWRTRRRRSSLWATGGVRGNPASSLPGSFRSCWSCGRTTAATPLSGGHEADLLLLDVPAEELRDVDTAQALEELKAEDQV